MSKIANGKKLSNTCCGECCWFVFETTEGNGQCMKAGGHGLPYGLFRNCCSQSCGRFVSREDKDRYISLLRSFLAWMKNKGSMPEGDEFVEAVKFATEYIKTFGQL